MFKSRFGQPKFRMFSAADPGDPNRSPRMLQYELSGARSRRPSKCRVPSGARFVLTTRHQSPPP